MSSLSPISDLQSPSKRSEPDGEVLVRVENVSKIFCRDLKKSLLYGLQDSARDLLSWGKKSEIRDQRSTSSDDSSSTSDLRPQSSSSSRVLRDGEFLAVDNVSFELRRGECLGLIGRNGAGKTTLLKMLNGLIKPDAGRIEMRGRVGALIALGAGFNPILSGRENIYVNGSILGLTKAEIEAKIDDIIDFAEIGEFIDAPIQSYSSGMQVRLGFAVATAMEPDVLILDEVLAVGDSNFRTKCFVRISAIIQNTAVIFVSHSEEQLSRICTSGLLLENGKVASVGELRTCLDCYRERQPTVATSAAEYHDIAVKQAQIHFSATEHVSGEDLPFEIHYTVDHTIQLSLHVLSIVDENESAVAACDLLTLSKIIASGRSIVSCSIKSLSLRPGIYTLGLEALSNHSSVVVRKRFTTRIRVTNSITHWCSYTPKVIFNSK